MAICLRKNKPNALRGIRIECLTQPMWSNLPRPDWLSFDCCLVMSFNVCWININIAGHRYGHILGTYANPNVKSSEYRLLNKIAIKVSNGVNHNFINININLFVKDEQIDNFFPYLFFLYIRVVCGCVVIATATINSLYFVFYPFHRQRNEMIFAVL